MVRRAAARIAFGLAAASLAYGVVAYVAVRRFDRREATDGDALAATILVPLHGNEPGLEARLRAFVEQDGDAHQVIFGVSESHDTALPIAERVASAYPRHAVDISIGRDPAARNPKVANLLAMMRLVRRPVVVLVDSDMHVSPEYLRAVTSPLRDEAVGAVTCVYGGVPDGALASRLGAMFITEQFVPSALVERMLGPLRHCFGATIAVRVPVLESIGGLQTVAAHLADDHVLGQRIAQRGFELRLARYVPRNAVSEAGVRALWNHEVRWHRTIRAVQPAGYAAMCLTYPVPLATTAWLLASRRRSPAVVVAVAIAVRIALGRAASDALGVAPGPVWLLPVRDAFGLAVWAAGLFGSVVRWRDDAFVLGGGDRFA